jgi:hypothetical protein
VQRPSRRFLWIAIDLHQSRRFVIANRDFKAVQWKRQASPNRLDESLFSCPAAKEGGYSLLSRCPLDAFELSRAEVSASDVIQILNRANPLYVDTEFASACKRKDGQPSGVGHVEGKVGCVVIQAWFAMRSDSIAYRLRPDTGIPSYQDAKDRPGRDELPSYLPSPAVAIQDFGGWQQCAALLKATRSRVEPDRPEMNEPVAGWGV